MITKPIKKVGSLAGMESGTGTGGDTQEKAVGRPLTTPRQQYRIMDDVARKRRLKHELDLLERDNYHEDPHANLTLNKKVPKFDDGPKGSEKNSDRRKSNLRLKMLNFGQLVEEDSKRNPPNYTTATAPSPEKFNLPQRHFCGVCGHTGKYTCITCGARFCCMNCQQTHKETRCMKWIA